MIRNSPLWQHKAEIMQSIPGVGWVTAMTFLADVPEIGTLSRREISALVGVCPYSGTVFISGAAQHLGWTGTRAGCVVHGG